MKIATVFLVAVTVFTSLFLESSAAPLDLSQVLKQILADEKEKIDELNNIIEKNEAKCSTDAEKENLDKVIAFLEQYIPFADNINKKLLNDVEDPKNREKIVIELLEAVVDVLLRVLKLKADLTETLQEVAVAIENIFVGTIVRDATEYAKLLIQSLPTEKRFPGQQTLNKQDLGSSLKQILADEKEKIDELNNIIENNVAKCSTDAEKENLDKVIAFLEQYIPFADNINKKLLNDVEDPKNRKKIVIELLEAVVDVLLRVLKLKADLTETLQEVAVAIENIFVGTIVRDATEYAKLLIQSLPTEKRFPGQQTLNKQDLGSSLKQILADEKKKIDELNNIIENNVAKCSTDAEKENLDKVIAFLEQYIPFADNINKKLLNDVEDPKNREKIVIELLEAVVDVLLRVLKLKADLTETLQEVAVAIENIFVGTIVRDATEYAKLLIQSLPTEKRFPGQQTLNKQDLGSSLKQILADEKEKIDELNNIIENNVAKCSTDAEKENLDKVIAFLEQYIPFADNINKKLLNDVEDPKNREKIVIELLEAVVDVLLRVLKLKAGLTETLKEVAVAIENIFVGTIVRDATEYAKLLIQSLPTEKRFPGQQTLNKQDLGSSLKQILADEKEKIDELNNIIENNVAKCSTDAEKENLDKVIAFLEQYIPFADNINKKLLNDVEDPKNREKIVIELLEAVVDVLLRVLKLKADLTETLQEVAVAIENIFVGTIVRDATEYAKLLIQSLPTEKRFPGQQTLNKQDLGSSLKQILADEKEKIHELNNIIENNVAKCSTDAEKENLDKVIAFLEQYIPFADNINKKLLNDVEDPKNRKKIVIELLEAVVDVLLRVLKLKADLTETLQEVAVAIENIFVGTIVRDATEYAKLLIQSLPTEKRFPGQQTLNKQDLGSSLKQILADEKKKIDELNNIIENNVAKCSTDAEKENLDKVIAFLEQYIPFADNINKKLLNDVEDPKNREKIVIEILEAVVDVLLRVLKLKADLTETLQEVAVAIENIFVGTIVRDATEYAKLLIQSLPTEKRFPGQQTLNKQDLGSSLKQILADEKEKIDELNNIIENNVAKCSTDAENENLDKVIAFLEQYIPFADNINKKLLNDVEDPKNREKIVIELLEAVVDVLLRVLKLKADLTETLQEVAVAIENIFVGTIVRDATEYAKLLIQSLPTEKRFPGQQTLNKQDLGSSLKQILADEKEKIDELNNIIENNVAKCSTDAEKENLDKVIAFLEQYIPFADNINKKLLNDVEDPKNREKIVIELLEAVVDVLLRVLKLKADLTETLQEVAVAIENIFVGTIVRDATEYAKLLIQSLPTEKRFPGQQTLNKQALGSSLKQILADEKEKIDELNNIIENNVAKCSTDAEKENLDKVTAFLEQYIPFADNINKKLLNDVEDPKNREKIVIELLEAVVDVLLRVLKLKADLTETLQEVAVAIENIFVGTIVRDATEYAKLLIQSLHTENSLAGQQIYSA